MCRILIISFILFSCDKDNILGTYKTKIGGPLILIILNKDSTYFFRFPGYFKGSDVIEQSGRWEKELNYLTLNSSEQPKNNSLIKVKEINNPEIKGDTIMIEINNDDGLFAESKGDTVLLTPPSIFELNRIKYTLKDARPIHKF